MTDARGDIGIVILAAGMSRRMGRPKMLLPWEGTTVLGQVATVLVNASTDSGTDGWRKTDERIKKVDAVVVTGGARELVEAEAARLAESLPVRTVFNAQFEVGEMMSSIRVGLAELGPEVEWALIGLGDQPQVSRESARRIVSARDMPSARLIIPSFNLRRGHPWLVKRELWLELCAAQTARDFLNAHANEIFYVECDESVLKDLDTPEDYARDLKSSG